MKKIIAACVFATAAVSPAIAQTQTGSEPWDWAPAVSPDGKLIVFVSERGGDDDLYIWNRERRELRLLLDTDGPLRYPHWSPDGKWIVFSSGSDNGRQYDIHKIRADGTDRTVLRATDKPEVLPVFSPDGEWIAFSGSIQGDDRAHIQVMRMDGSDHRVVTKGSNVFDEADYAFSPDWSPDGKTLAFVAGVSETDEADVWTVNIETGEAAAVMRTPKFKEMGPAFSPDGKYIAVSYGIETYTLYRVGLIDLENDRFLRTDAAAEFHTHPQWGPVGEEGELIYHEMIHSGALIARYDLSTGKVTNFGIPGSWEEMMRGELPEIGKFVE